MSFKSSNPNLSFFGELHNDALDNFFYNFSTDEQQPYDIIATEAVDFTYNFLDSELTKKGYNLSSFGEPEYIKDIIQYSKGIDITVLQSNPNFDLNQLDQNYAYNIHESAQILNNSGIYNASQQIIINKFVDLLQKNYEGNINDQELYDSLLTIRNEIYSNIDYSKLSDQSLAVMFDISLHSLEWWSNYDERLNSPRPKIAPWIGMDCAGVIVGMAGAIIASGIKDSTKPVDGKDVLIGAVVTGVAASTGVVGRLGRFFNGGLGW